MNPATPSATFSLGAFDAVTSHTTKSPAGLLLAAGAGQRMGTPKALVDDWLLRGIDVLTAAGCDPVVVVLGAALREARALLHGRAAEGSPRPNVFAHRATNEADSAQAGRIRDRLRKNARKAM